MCANNDCNRCRMNIVVVGHVDHGKSTVLGRLLADTGSLPDGKLQQVKNTCRKNSKPFEYAFLLDALKDEQSQGITIDSARCFFKTKKRDYIIVDAPGHIEFLKNMVTGAANAEAAVLVIDAKDGIQENSKRHGHMVSMLGIKQVSVLVNKLDLVEYDKTVFGNIKSEYSDFLKELNIYPTSFIPISAFMGDNIATSSDNTGWYKGPTVLEQLDAFEKQASKEKLPFRFPVQDIYKFTEEGDDRRIIVGTIESGTIKVGDEVAFLPSLKKSKIKSIEGFNVSDKKKAYPDEAPGFTLAAQIYIKPGEVMVKASDIAPKMSSRFKANMFWMGKAPLVKNKIYKLKVGTARVGVKLVDIISVLDASELTSVTNKNHVDRHDVAECVFETIHPVVFDIVSDIETMGRFVIVDNYEIAGGGIILESLSDEDTMLNEHIKKRESLWETGFTSKEERQKAYKHKSRFVVITGVTGESDAKMKEIAKDVERELFKDDLFVYYLALENIILGLGEDLSGSSILRDEYIRRAGELARILTDSGQIFITTIPDLEDYEAEVLALLNKPNDMVIITMGENNFNKFKDSNIVFSIKDETDVVEKICAILKN